MFGVRCHFLLSMVLCLWGGQVQATPAVDTLLMEYASAQGVGAFDAAQGEARWYASQAERSCTSCHGMDLNVAGRHHKTGKVIEPMARSVNPERLTEVKKIRKWLLRNCKWTYDRECTAQEKGDFLLWLRDQ